MAISDTAKDSIFLRWLLRESEYMTNEQLTLNIKKNVEKFASNPVYHKRTKHIDIRFHHVHEVVKNKVITLKNCPTQRMVAEVLTKNLSKIQLEYLGNSVKRFINN